MDSEFAVFIISNGRADNVITYPMLRRQGYTGEIYIIIDDEDSQHDRYWELYGDQVVVFSKKAIAKTFDEYDNFSISRGGAVYARNACFGIAELLGIKWFLVLDDDYRQFEYRFNGQLVPGYYGRAKNLDQLFKYVLAFYQSIPALTIAFSQAGDLLGGADGGDLSRLWLKRKAMNTFWCCTDRPFTFTGRINEDTNMYTVLGNRGHLIFSFYNAGIVPTITQQQEGGMTQLYLDYGTYVKSFYTVMACPSFVKVADMGESHKRFHHKINWANAVPVIISEKHRKLA